ncbi:putative P-type Na+-ATPase [Sphaerosporella brunnea]|uniref:P-type Na(+) transporter n=1 Tax=Sphaerosporella brunnea TaxID=1250544 RepID=A0A5J5EYA0_9PEZI|nr:putative P-type Na+-ATPase [Sphaerosporella brunnea]
MQNGGKDLHPGSGQGPVHQGIPANGELSKPAYLLSVEEVLRELNADPDTGLNEADAKTRLQKAGLNELAGGGGVSPMQILAGQIFNAMVLVLIMGMVVSFAIRSWIEAGFVTAVVVINIVVGFFQEYSAEKTMDSLRSLSSPTASVIRNGQSTTVRSADIAPGDIVEVKTGDTIPADLRLIEAMNFEADEALLTGESLPVAKKAEAVFSADQDVGVGDRINMAYSSSSVTKGRAKGIVVQTGMNTEIGKIAQSLRGGDSKVRKVRRNDDGHAKFHYYLEAGALTFAGQFGKFLGVNVGTPLQRKLAWLAILLFGIAVVFAIVCMAANGFKNEQAVILYAVGTGLSMIPASLIVVLTITMAVGTKIMVSRNVIVRKLDSLEALGAVTNICSDKTGTLTQGKMIVKKAWVAAEGTFAVSETNSPIDPTAAQISLDKSMPLEQAKIPKTQAQREAESPWRNAVDFLHSGYLQHYLNIATFCNIANIAKNKETDQWDARGDPTEIAIQVFTSRFDWNRRKFTHIDDPDWSQIAEYPFDSDVKRMAVVYRHRNGDAEKGYREWAFMKGAVERVLDSCTHIQLKDGVALLTEEWTQNVIRNMEALASQGLRVLALASREWTDHVEEWGKHPRSDVERNMTLHGLVGLYDPPRPETAGAVKECHRAGINVHMLTGDHPQTARSIAADVGIIPKNINSLSPDVISSMVMTASQFDRLSDEEIDNLPVLPLVIARCAPNSKVRMVEALHRRKKFVAMTGDGVNDSPALKRSDVGIGMGMAGSDVAKDASDIILTDDNFASILNAIEEGRRTFDNIKKFVLHLLAENIAQACTLLIGLVFKDNTGLSVFPLAPVEILWIIMITSGFPAMGLGMEVASDDIMLRPPHDVKTGIFTTEVLVDMAVYGFYMAALCLASFSIVVFGFGDGQLGEQCNDRYSANCDLVFRARSTTFVCLTWFALILAWEMVHLRRSFFRMEGKPEHPWTLWIRNVWRNKFLFWSVFAGFVTVFPIIYIPGLNHIVFKHGSISWEWGIVFIESGLFIAGIELWKLCKRVYFRRYGEKVANPEKELSGSTFSRYASIATSVSSGPQKPESDIEAQR